jgi:hypothetical protein
MLRKSNEPSARSISEARAGRLTRSGAFPSCPMPSCPAGVRAVPSPEGVGVSS